MDKEISLREWEAFSDMLTDQGWSVVARDGDKLTIRQQMAA